MTDESSPLPPPIQEGLSETEKWKLEAQDYKDKYLRLLAETDNIRKRLQKEKQEMTNYALQQLILDFLAPIDHMENALRCTGDVPEEVKNWSLGFQMILSQFQDVLANNGVRPFHAQGTPFDPHCHEAVEAVASSDFPPGTVMEEFIRGYKIGEKTLRPARVKVSKAIDDTTSEVV